MLVVGFVSGSALAAGADGRAVVTSPVASAIPLTSADVLHNQVKIKKRAETNAPPLSFQLCSGMSY